MIRHRVLEILSRSLPVCASLLLSLGACQSDRATSNGQLRARAGSAPIRITVVGTNDIHGWVAPHRWKLPSGLSLEQGGISTFAGYLAILRADNPAGTLLVDAGDLFQGTLVSNLTEGAVVVDAYNYLGYQASAIGNHEFDYGPEGPISVALAPGSDPFGALKQRLRQANFPLLAVNIYDAATGERPQWLTNDGTMIVERNGLKIGILGLITPTTPQTTNPINVSSLRFGSLIPEALSAAKNLRSNGADLVIAIVHVGAKCARYDNPRDLSSCDTANGELFEMLQGLPPRTFDAVVAGHSHQVIGHFVNEMPVIESWGLGRYFGVIELWVDPLTKTVLQDRTQIEPVVPICERVEEVTKSCEPEWFEKQGKGKFITASFRGRPIERDRRLDKLLAPALAKVESEENRKLGLRTLKTLKRDYEAETALGNLLTDSLREMEHADVSLMNAGGLRADIPAGELTYGQVYEVLPFDNNVAMLTVNGDELLRLLRAAYGNRRGVLQISGIKVQLSRCRGLNRLRSATLDNGAPLVPDKVYRVALTDFMARGGDGLSSVLSSFRKDQIDVGDTRELNIRDALVAFWQRKGADLRPPALGRVTVLDDQNGCETGPRAKAP